ncbi:P-loop NTPase [Dickeya fangzhongdai]|uniref:KGGVGR-motif variant AAA ATPase n=1 Tax=Dickeya fangzhongdai TaxID=1778540 RepID=UPI001EFB86F9|nr:P-loop NTPase [Dickeya fangzhongdai]ULR31124.1 P-loop NTPase [Dickeya fangzhongdai]
MITFDELLPKIKDILKHYADLISHIQPVVINRDLNGKVRLIVSESIQNNPEHQAAIDTIAAQFSTELSPHSFAPDNTVLYEPNVESVYQRAAHFALADIPGVYVVDRLATESRWDMITPESEGASRIVFFSIKGGVGRSTAMAACAWALAQAGKKVMVLDLDLESPGLSTALLPEDRRPTYGIADWLVEDLVDNGNSLLDDMIATSTLSHDGDIYVIPAHGKNPGEYIAKLGRVWMPKIDSNGNRESWSHRLNRLIAQLEETIKPDVILIDSRSGIDEVASSCVTDIGANTVLLFTLDGEQTWSGYRVLFEYWNRSGKAADIRERLQLIGAIIPDDERRESYFSGLCENAYELFSSTLYDEVPPGETVENLFSFEMNDEAAPHYPWAIRWNRGFSALTSLHSRFAQNTIDSAEVQSIFGTLIEGVQGLTNHPGEHDE